MALIEELPAPGERLYNLEKIREMSRGNEVFVKRMVHIFAERLPSLLEDIQEAYSLGNYKKVYDIAHLLKPSLDNMGVVTVKSTVRAVEDLAIGEPASPLLPAHINRLETILMMVFEQLKEELK